MILYIQYAISIAMLVTSCVGLVLSEMQKIGSDEPQVVLRLSWIALIFAALTALFASGGG